MAACRSVIARLASAPLIASRTTVSIPRASPLSLRLRSLLTAAGYPVAAATSMATVGCRAFSVRSTTSSLNDPSPNWSNRPPKETILLDGCDFEHWLVVVEPPDPNLTRDEIIDSYIKTLAQVVGSEQEARMKIYSVSTKHYFAFGALVSEELSYKIKELPKVRWVLPDSYLDVKNKDYGGEPFINGEAVPYDPKYHEEWVRNNARANERSRRNDRPRDRSRNFERRRENMQNFQNREMPPPPPPPSSRPNPELQNQQNPIPSRDAPPPMPNRDFMAPPHREAPGIGENYPNSASRPVQGFSGSPSTGPSYRGPGAGSTGVGGQPVSPGYQVPGTGNYGYQGQGQGYQQRGPGEGVHEGGPGYASGGPGYTGGGPGYQRGGPSSGPMPQGGYPGSQGNNPSGYQRSGHPGYNGYGYQGSSSQGYQQGGFQSGGGTGYQGNGSSIYQGGPGGPYQQQPGPGYLGSGSFGYQGVPPPPAPPSTTDISGKDVPGRDSQ